VPQLFVATAHQVERSEGNFPGPWAGSPATSETRIYAKYLLRKSRTPKIACSIRTTIRKDYLKGLKDGLGAKAASMIIIEEPYRSVRADIDSQHRQAESLNADVFRQHHHAEVRAQAIKKIGELGWKPLHFSTRQRLDRQRDQAGRLRERAGRLSRVRSAPTLLQTCTGSMPTL